MGNALRFGLGLRLPHVYGCVPFMCSCCLDGITSHFSIFLHKSLFVQITGSIRNKIKKSSTLFEKDSNYITIR